MTESELIKNICKHWPCDAARVIQFEHTEEKFLVLGWNKRSENEWFNQDNEPVNFDYLEEKILARGTTIEELWSNIVELKKQEDQFNAEKDPVKRMFLLFKLDRE